jgi:hypothetical protein
VRTGTRFLTAVAAFVAVLSAMASLTSCSTGDDKLDPAAVKAMCQASEDAVRADHRAERAFEYAAAASQQGGWDQGLAMVDGRRSWPATERERWRRLSAALFDASRKRTETTVVALRATKDISAMYAKAVHLADQDSMSALDKCRADADPQ